MFPVHDTIRSRHFPIMNWALMIVNAIAFLWELAMPREALEGFIYHFGIVPARISHPEWAEHVGLAEATLWPFLTSMFLHGGWMHFIANMWSLWIFGDNVEDRMGPVRYLCFYLLCGLAAGVVHFVTNISSTVPTIGASGAIAGVMGAYLILYPRSRIVTLVPLFFYPLFFELPAALFIGVWFFTQFWSGALSLVAAQNVGGIAWWAHIGGFVAGMFGYGLFLNRRREPRRFHRPESKRRTVLVYRPDGSYYKLER